ncbi:transmembrane protein 119 [Ornithorhynchus anatinus]|uniref:Transmembrane protein 119 n=1 Tax=Ornithorhynchus anatinus TaxID=9258 RepID=A0A6I8N2D0_ORNAN|nr:transmembrane protein 119 [Ornithorhynchus anatinus]
MASRIPCFLLLLLPLLLRAAHTSLLEDGGASGEGEGSSSASLPPASTPKLSRTSIQPHPTPLDGPAAPAPATTNFLDGIVDFFKEYMLLISVVGSLAFLLLFIVCTALVVRQKHKASAYYPSSFPKKKYVHPSDKAGGGRAFSEVPEKPPAARPQEPLDASCQLQADILAATQNLRSPARGPSADGDGVLTEERPPAAPHGGDEFSDGAGRGSRKVEEEEDLEKADGEPQRESQEEEEEKVEEEMAPASLLGMGSPEGAEGQCPEAAPAVAVAEEVGATAELPLEAPGEACACSSRPPEA